MNSSRKIFKADLSLEREIQLAETWLEIQSVW